MHEMSIAKHLLEIATEKARENSAERITAITLRLGALSCVHKDALKFSFDVVAEGTLAEGAELNYIDVPVTIHCPACQRDVEIPGITGFRCPKCDTASADVRRGKEMDVDSIELIQSEPMEASP